MTILSGMKADILDIVNARTVEVCIDLDVEALGENPEEAPGDSRDEVYLILGLTVDDRLTSCLECDMDNSDIVLPLFSLYTSPEGHWIVPDTNLPLHLNTDYVYSATLLTSGSTIVVGDRQLFYTIDSMGRSDEDKPSDSNQVPPKPRRHNDDEDSLNTMASSGNDDLLSHLTSPEQISNYSASLVCQQLIRLQCDFPSHEMDSLYKSFEEAVFVPFHSKLFREFIGSFFGVNDIMCGGTTCFDWDQMEGYDFMRDILSGDKDHMLQHSWDSYFQSLVVRLLTDLIREIADPVEHVVLWMKILFVFTSSSFKDTCGGGECGQPGIVFTHVVLPLFTTLVGCLSVHSHQPFIQTLSSDILYQLISGMTMSSFIKVVRIPVVDVIVETATHDQTDVALTRSLCRTLNCVTSSLVEFIQDGLQSASAGYSVDLEENISKLMGLLDHLALVAFPVVVEVRERNGEDEILHLGTKMMIEFFQNSANQNRLETIQVGLIESADLEQSPDGRISNNQSNPSDGEGTEDGTDAFVVVPPGSEEFIPSGVESAVKLKSTQQKTKKTGFGKIVSSFSNVFKKHTKSKLVDRSEEVTCARESSGRDNADDRCGTVLVGSIPGRDEPSYDQELTADQSTRYRGTEVTKQDLANGHSNEISDQSCSEILSNEMIASNDSNENHIHSLEAPQSPPENVLLIASLSKPSKARKSGIAGAMKHYLKKMSARKSTAMLAPNNEPPSEIQTNSCLEGFPLGIPSRGRSEQNVSSMPSTKTINVSKMIDMPVSNSCLNETIESDLSPQNFDSNNNKGIEDRGRKKHAERNEKLADGSEIEHLGDRVRSVRNKQRPALKQLFPICSSEICEEELMNDLKDRTVPTSEDTITEQTIGCDNNREELSTELMSEEELKSATGQSAGNVYSYENELSSDASVLLSTKYNKLIDISSANLMREDGQECVNSGHDVSQLPCKQTGLIPQTCSLGNEISNGGRSAMLDILSKSDSEEIEFDEELAREFAFVEEVETEFFIAENNDYVQKYDILRGNDSTLIGTDEEQPEIDVRRFLRIDETNNDGGNGNSISSTSKSSIDSAHQTFVETNPGVESEISQEAFQLVEQIFQHQQPGAAEEWSIDRLDTSIKYILADISGSTGTGDHWQVLSEDIDPTIFLHILDTIVKCRLSSECVLKLLQLLTTFLERSPPSHLLKPACLILNNIITGSMLASFQEGWGYFSLRRIQKMTDRILQESFASSSSSLTSLNAADETAIDAVVDTVDAVDDDTMTTVRSLNDAMNKLFASRRIS